MPVTRLVNTAIDGAVAEASRLGIGGKALTPFLLDKIHAQGGSLGREMHISSTEAIKQGVMHGLGFSILSRFTVAHELAAGRLCEVPIASMRFERGIRVVFRRDKLLSPAALQFLDSLIFDRNAEATALT